MSQLLKMRRGYMNASRSARNANVKAALVASKYTNLKLIINLSKIKNYDSE